MIIKIQVLNHHTFEQFVSFLSGCTDNHIHLDLHEVRELDPYGLLAMVLAIRNLSERGHLVTLAPPSDKQILDFIVEAQVFQVVSEFIQVPFLVFDRSPVFDDKILPICKVDPRQGYTEMLRVIKVVSTGLKLMLYGRGNAFLSKTADKFITSVTELCGNIQHSQDYGYVVAKRYARSSEQWVTVTVADLGVGITPPLKEKYSDAINKWADHKAIKLAMQPEISSRPQGGGIGLTELDTFVSQTEGISLVIRSGTAKLAMSSKGKFWSKSLPYFPGTQVSVTIMGRMIG